MGFTVVGLILLIPFVYLTNLGAAARSEIIPPHMKPGIAHNELAMLIFSLVWLAVGATSLTFLFLGNGWWALALFPAGLIVVGILFGALRAKHLSR